MGAAVSSNVAKAVTDCSTNITNSTQTNTQQVNLLSQDVNFTNCSLIAGGDIIVSQIATNTQNAKQLIAVSQNSSVSNTIAQKMMQSAMSTVGSLGLGYASATNAVSMTANVSTTISNNVNTSLSQFSNTANTFTCSGSTFIAKGNISISQAASSNAISSQIVTNNQVASVVNQISQTSDQKASATVEGIGAGIIAIAILIIAIGWSSSKVLSSGSSKIIIMILLLFVVLFMWIRETPPFFDKDLDCVGSQNTIDNPTFCTNLKDGKVVINQVPLRYMYPIISSGIITTEPNLLGMIISIFSNGNTNTPALNGGYNQTNCAQLKTIIDTYNNNSLYGSNLGLPYILINPVTNSATDFSSGYKIPNEYQIGPKEGDENWGVCSPGSIQYNNDNGSIYSPGTSCLPNGFAKNIQPVTNGSPFITNLNWSAWNTWLTGHTDRQKKARFILCKIINDKIGANPPFDLSIYISNDEYVRVDNKIDTAVSINTKAGSDNLLIKKYSTTACTDPDTGFTYIAGCGSNTNGGSTLPLTSGTLSTQVGVVNNNSHKFHVVSNYVLIAIILAFTFYLYISSKNANDPESSKNASTSTPKK